MVVQGADLQRDGRVLAAACRNRLRTLFVSLYVLVVVQHLGVDVQCLLYSGVAGLDLGGFERNRRQVARAFWLSYIGAPR